MATNMITHSKLWTIISSPRAKSVPNNYSISSSCRGGEIVLIKTGGLPGRQKMLHYNQWPFYKQHKFNWKPIDCAWNSPWFSSQVCHFCSATVCSVGSVGDAGRQRHAAPGGGALLCGGGDGGGHPELGQVRPQPLGSGEHPRDTLLVQCSCVNQKWWCTSTVLY